MALPEEEYEATGQAATGVDAHNLVHAGFQPCLNQACNYYFHPNSVHIDSNHNVDCPQCKQEYNLWDAAPFSKHDRGDIREQNPALFHAVDTPNGRVQYAVGGGTIAGLSMAEQGALAEQIVQDMGELPGYGPITGARSTYHSPADLTCGEWAVEVKSANFDGKHLRFWPGSKAEKASRNVRAEQAGHPGILGVLVVLNFRDSEADVYVREMPFAGVKVNGKMTHGLFAYRTHTGMRLAERIPFSNPLLNPHVPHQDPDIPF